MTFIWNDKINYTECKELFQSNGWEIPSEEIFNGSFNHTWKWVACRVNDRLTGFARILSDGFYHAYICSMIVALDHQGRGIGSKMMSLIINEITVLNLKPVLTAKDSVKGFYEKFGFTADLDNTQAMILRKNVDSYKKNGR